MRVPGRFISKSSKNVTTPQGDEKNTFVLLMNPLVMKERMRGDKWKNYPEALRFLNQRERIGGKIRNLIQQKKVPASWETKISHRMAF